VEEQPQVEDTRAISYRHADGELFEANSLEAARQMCSVLGKMSLEEADLLLELAAMGKEQIVDQQDASQIKPVIEKIDKVKAGHTETNNTTNVPAESTVNKFAPEEKQANSELLEPIAEDVDEAFRVAVKPTLQAMLIQPTEAAHIITDDSKIFEDTEAIHFDQPKPVEKLQASPRVEEDHFQVTREGVVATTESPLSEPIEAVVGTDLIEHTEAELNYEDTVHLANAGLETDEVIPFISSMDESTFEYQDALEALALPNEALPFVEDKPDDTNAYISPVIAIPELPAPIAEIETTVEQLVAALDSVEFEKLEKIEAILEKIIAIPTSTELVEDGDQEKLDEKLEELIVALFEEAAIDYSPELVESFIKLTKAHYLDELLAVAKDTEKEQGLPDEIGTREFLQKLQHGLSAMKQAVTDFYELGKSILRLYRFSFETAALGRGPVEARGTLS
jgi:hypothetical protein